MSNNLEMDPMLELFVFETLELIAKLENIAIDSEKANVIEEQVHEVFRIMHTIKSSAAMMNYDNIASLSHSLEDAFFYIRENKPKNVDYSTLTDIILRSSDFIKNAINQIQSGITPERDASAIIREINEFISILKDDNSHLDESGGHLNAPSMTVQESNEKPEARMKFRFKAVIYFDNGCEMENIRAFNVLHKLENLADIIRYVPGDILVNPNSAEAIKSNGFEIEFFSDLSMDDIKNVISDTLFLRELKLELVEPKKQGEAGAARDNENDNEKEREREQEKEKAVEKDKVREIVKSNADADYSKTSVKQTMISINVAKLDKLMDLVGELVISQAMVIHNPELEGLNLNSFNKASSQLQKLTNELQDAVMSIRMVPLSATLQKMHRIVRDVGRKLSKDIRLEIIGEETEVDKNIIEHLSDPLIHLVRNAVDHGIEPAEERLKKGKPATGTITLEAKNEGGDVWIIVRDDGKGLDRNKILEKARQKDLIKKPEHELTDRDIYSMIFLPGFSTSDKVTEYSGRGVGMDVVNKNIEAIGGSVHVDSIPDAGTTVSIKIPLTLAIIDGMKVRVGKTIYIIPITSVRESFKVQEFAIIRDDANDREMIMLRGICCPVIRLHEAFHTKPDTTDLTEGIIVVIENDGKTVCLFADEILGVQQVVVKALPKYIKKIKGISGCTVMGNGSVSLIIDVSGLVNSS